MSTHPSPDSYSSGINVTFRGPVFGCIDLVLNFMLSEVPFDGISKLATFEASATTVNYYDNVLQRTCQVMVPIALPAGVNHLRSRTTITVSRWSIFNRFFIRCSRVLARGTRRGILCDRYRPLMVAEFPSR